MVRCAVNFILVRAQCYLKVTPCRNCRSGFTTLPPMLLQEQPVVVLLLKSDLVSWSLTIDERSGHEDLYGSGHRSVISYIHGITGLYCSSLPCLCEPEPFSSDRLTSVKWRMLGLVA
jgi:hypothetical protein